MDLLIAKYGLIALYFGAALEGDASVMAGGVLYHKGLLGFWPVVLTAAIGAWTSDLAIYGLARRSTRSAWIAARMGALSRHRVISRLLSRPLLLSLAFRFVPGARTIGPVALATAGDVPPLRYAAMTAVAGLAWALLLVTSGRLVAHFLELLLGELRLHTHLAIWGLAIAASLALALYLRRRWFD